MERIELGSCEALLSRADPDKVAVVLPGMIYPVTAPLLWFAREVLLAAGWSVMSFDELPDDDPVEWVAMRAGAALDWVGEARAMVVAKSVSTHAAEVAAARGIPGVWLTPLLDDADVLTAMAAIDAPGLTVGSISDATWSQRASLQLRRMEVLQVTGADHNLQIPGDPGRSLELLGRVADRIGAFARRLG